MTRTAPAYSTKYNSSSGLYELHYTGANFTRIEKWLDQYAQEMIGFRGEVERTNLCPYSKDLSNWSKNDAGDGLDTSTQLSPNGIDYMQGMKADETVGLHHFYKAFTISSGVTYCVSAFFKKGSNLDWIAFTINDGSTKGNSFNLSTLEWGNNASGGGFLTKGYIDYGNSIIELWGTILSAGTIGTISIFPSASNGNANFAGGTVGATTVNLYVWGAQTEIGIYPSSYIPTTTGAVIRTADSALRFAAGGNIGSEDMMRGSATFKLLMKSRPTATRNLLSISDGGSSADEIKVDVLTDGTLVATSAASGGNAGSAACALDVCDNKIYLVGVHWQNNHLNLHVKNIYTGTVTNGNADTDCAMPDDLDRIELGVQEYGLTGDLALFRTPIRNPATLFSAAA
jgi:hypothetical protein